MADVSILLKLARRRSKEDKASSQARFKEILAIVKKYDLKEGLTPQMTVDLIQDLGTTFVKLGQIASTHPDVLPAEYCEALGSLRTSARPLEFSEVKAQVESELGKPLDELFASFDENPLGSASIAQVHRAELPSGEIVAVKVQRPGIVETVTDDLAILERTIHHISPRLNIMAVLVDYLKTSFDPNSLRRSAASLAAQATDSAAAMAALPMRIDQTLDMVQKGHVKLGMELSSNERFSRDIRAAAGLVAIALIAMGLIIGACILGASASAITLGGVPLFGGLGLIVGIVLGVYVFLNIRPYLK